MSVEASAITQDIWTRLEGRPINGAFTLRRCLGTSDHSGVFLTEFPKRGLAEVALKLMPIGSVIPDSYVARWRTAGRLGHPQLLRLLEAGRCQIDRLHYLYLVMEYSDQNLAQLLARRALTEDEVREMLPSVLGALAFLHERNFVHAQLTPANILVVGDQLKLASDTIRTAGEPSERIGAKSAYEPPEAQDGVYSPAGDVWALGVMLCEALSRQQPSGLHDSVGGFSLPPELSPRFMELVARCLSRAPAARPTVADIEAWTRGVELPPAPVGVAESAVVEEISPPAHTPPLAAPRQATPEAASVEVASRTPIATPNDVVSRAVPVASPKEFAPRSTSVATSPAETAARQDLASPVAGQGFSPAGAEPPVAEASQPPAGRASPGIHIPFELPFSRRTAILIAAGLAAFVLSWAGLRALRSKPVSAPPAAAAPASPTSTLSATSTPTVTPGAPPAARNAAPPAAAPNTKSASAETRAPQQVHEVIPDVPRSARQTIRGHIKVSVRVIIDNDGTVFAALTEVRGPSRYFERLALDAAKKWTFTPTESDTQRLMLLRFDFTRQGTTARAVPLE